ncbi:unnamed protein product [Adineta steineri]|uniref:Uncharacterized protein n=1 Tax=Adineta steineri TaxID=433720 RepID=A0A820D7B5_9BILA|nr:unnamed protein product [Adineta steineri]
MVSRDNYIILLDIGRSKGKDFGYTLTDRALTYLYNRYQQSPSECQYIIITNGDNFYSRDLGKDVLPHMEAKKDIIAWGFVSRYFRPDYISVLTNFWTSPRVVDMGTAKCMSVALITGSIDLGTVAYRLAFLQQHNLHFHYPNGNYSNLSDGYFVEQAAKLTKASVILRQTLFVRQ